jgi:ferredoxin
VIRLGGNFEEEAIRIMATYLADLPAKVEGYGRDDAPEACARRLEELIAAGGGVGHEVRPIKEPRIPEGAYTFETLTGKLHIDHRACAACASKGCVAACALKILTLAEGRPVLAIPPEEARKGKCTECLACEIFCRYHEKAAIVIHLPIPGLKEYRDRILLKIRG